MPFKKGTKHNFFVISFLILLIYIIVIIENENSIISSVYSLPVTESENYLQAESHTPSVAETSHVNGESSRTSRISSKTESRAVFSNNHSDKPNVYDNIESNDVVWISKSGTKFHSSPNCSNMINPIEISIEEAISRGRTPCKKCY